MKHQDSRQRRYIKIFAAVCALAGALHLASLVHFAISPASHYYRSWEYLDDVLYRSAAYGETWQGEEKSDLTRSYLFFYQDSSPTRVTIDQYGFRAMPADDSEPVDYAVVGDSQAWGLRLDDRETISWQLAELSESQVLNLSRFHLCRGLHHPSLGASTTIVEVRTEYKILGPVFPYDCEDDQELVPLERSDGVLDLLLSIHPRRYSPLFQLPWLVTRLKGDVVAMLAGGPRAHLFHYHTMEPSNLEEAVQAISRRHKELAEQGYGYLFVPVPAKQSIYSDRTDPFTRDYLRHLHEALVEAGVPTLDLLTPFRERAEEELYFPYDTHVKPRGARLVAEEIAKYLKAPSSD